MGDADTELLPAERPDSSLVDEREKVDRPASFLRRLKESKSKGLIQVDGNIVFVPVFFGQPLPPLEEERFTPDNNLKLNYSPEHALTFVHNRLRTRNLDEIVDSVWGGKKQGNRERERAIRDFDLVIYEGKYCKFNYNHGITSLTDTDGYLKISLNCPYPVIPRGDGEFIIDSSLPVPMSAYGDRAETKLLIAAMLREMEYDYEFRFSAVAYKPTMREEGNIF